MKSNKENIDRMKNRYRTTTVDGKQNLRHDGNCHFWGWGICTCGLLHDLIVIDDPSAIYFKYNDDRVRQYYELEFAISYKNRERRYARGDSDRRSTPRR